MNALPELQRGVNEALAVMLQLAAALAQVREGNVPQANQALTGVIASSGAGGHARRYAEEALYWRARLNEAQPEAEAKTAAARDYLALVRRLPAGRLRREAKLRLAILAEPGKSFTAGQALAASRWRLARIGRALHNYAADHAGRLPGALPDLLDGYITDAQTLVRPGPAGVGGARVYGYRPGLRAELGVIRTETGATVPLAGGIPVLVWEPVSTAIRAAAGGRPTSARLVLRLDGEIMSVQDTARPATRAGRGRAPNYAPPASAPPASLPVRQTGHRQAVMPVRTIKPSQSKSCSTFRHQHSGGPSQLKLRPQFGQVMAGRSQRSLVARVAPV